STAVTRYLPDAGPASANRTVAPGLILLSTSARPRATTAADAQSWYRASASCCPSSLVRARRSATDVAAADSEPCGPSPTNGRASAGGSGQDDARLCWLTSCCWSGSQPCTCTDVGRSPDARTENSRRFSPSVSVATGSPAS